MDKTIENERLKLTFRYDPNTLFSQRFESIGVVEQICLDGKYLFCEPEQRIAERVTCNGVGLCGEYVWDELAREAAPGGMFPKIGVGQLCQRPEGGDYSMWKDYKVEPYPVWAEFQKSSATFHQQIKSCLGVSADLTKSVSVQENEVHAVMTLHNTGMRRLELAEYQHNFLSLEGKAVGPGYRLDVPFAQELSQIADSAYDVKDTTKRMSGFMEADGSSIFWKREMDGHGYHLDVPGAKLDVSKGAYWKLSHQDSPVSVTEKLTFKPSRLVLWGIEHCICTEVYVPISVGPGQTQSWERIWRFDREADNA